MTKIFPLFLKVIRKKYLDGNLKVNFQLLVILEKILKDIVYVSINASGKITDPTF